MVGIFMMPVGARYEEGLCQKKIYISQLKFLNSTWINIHQSLRGSKQIRSEFIHPQRTCQHDMRPLCLTQTNTTCLCGRAGSGEVELRI